MLKTPKGIFVRKLGINIFVNQIAMLRKLVLKKHGFKAVFFRKKKNS